MCIKNHRYNEHDDLLHFYVDSKGPMSSVLEVVKAKGQLGVGHDVYAASADERWAESCVGWEL